MPANTRRVHAAISKVGQSLGARAGAEIPATGLAMLLNGVDVESVQRRMKDEG
jgi:hypothetical protein